MVLNISLIDRKNFLFHFRISSLPGGLAGKSLLARLYAQSTNFIHLFCAKYTPVLLHTYKQSDEMQKLSRVVYFAQNGRIASEWVYIYKSQVYRVSRRQLWKFKNQKRVFSGSSETHLPSYKLNIVTIVRPL